ncbi:MAG TPA: DUF805 domain-containing protein, partial [Polyangiales bacterium]|nr:DUF805 domain-containing protein [Polyangiales bacterium]
MRERLAFLFGMNGSVGRAEYLRTGLVLALLKYAGDNAILYAFTRQLMSPLRYSMMSLSLALPQRRLELGLIFAMALWSLPFLWIGMAMTLRRCADAGMRTRLSLLFLVPIVNYFLIVALCVAESSELPERIEPQRFLGTRRRALLLGVMSGIAVLVVSTGLSVFALHVYGAALFIGAPFVSGFVAAHVLTRGWPQATGRECAGVAVASVVGAGAALLLISWEGVMCLVMALPLAALVAMLGSAMGHWTALGSGHASPALVLLLAWPLLTAVEAHESSAPIRVVLSTIEVDRPVDRVWPHVIAFPELPPPHEWYFRNGIAYPVRARIRGQGAGAIRYCEFSTGPFVEPITTWDAPYR